MKKLILLAGLLAGMTVAAQSKFAIGPTGGMGHTFMMPHSDYEFQQGWNAGIASVCKISQRWGIGTDLRYSSEGGRFTEERGVSDIQLEYLRIPVKAILFLGREEQFIRPKVALGPSLGILVRESKPQGAPAAEKADFGFNATAGFDYSIVENVWLNFDLSYYQGLVKVRPANAKKEYNGNVGLNLGITVGLPERM
jgi:hypothetical protein